jgi:surfactin synthase thioesterase subunit
MIEQGDDLLFCFPYAGESAFSIFQLWKDYLNTFKIVPVEYSGHLRRINEPLFSDLKKIAQDVANKILRVISDKGYFFYGHSMGCWVIHEVCSILKRINAPLPSHLFLGAMEPPHYYREEKISDLNDYEFLLRVQKNGKLPQTIMFNDEVKNTFIPILKNDYKAVETYKPEHFCYNLPVPITVLYGKFDPIPRTAINDWAKYTSMGFECIEFDGDHFFIHQKGKKILKLLEKTILYSNCYK